MNRFSNVIACIGCVVGVIMWLSVGWFVALIVIHILSLGINPISVFSSSVFTFLYLYVTMFIIDILK